MNQSEREDLLTQAVEVALAENPLLQHDLDELSLRAIELAAFGTKRMARIAGARLN